MDKENEKKQKLIIPPIPAAPYGFPFQFVPTDPEGSYTGVPENVLEEPVQDVDDL